MCGAKFNISSAAEAELEAYSDTLHGKILGVYIISLCQCIHSQCTAVSGPKAVVENKMGMWRVTWNVTQWYLFDKRIIFVMFSSHERNTALNELAHSL